MAIVPVIFAHTPSASSTGGDEDDFRDDLTCRYALVEASKLPSIDLSKSVRSAMLSPQASAVISALARKFAQVINLLFLGCVVMGMLVCLLPAASARFLAVVTVVGLPASFAVLSSLRYEIVRLLLKTYEFWFFTLTNVLSSALLAGYLSDARVAVIPTLFFGTFGTILVDANSGVRRGFVIASMFAGLYILVLLVYAAMHMIDEAQHFMLFRTNARALSVEDALLNGWGTIVVLTFRNVYRKRAALKKHGANSTVVQCISYRCRLKLVRILQRRSMSATTALAMPQNSLSVAASRDGVIDEGATTVRACAIAEPASSALAASPAKQASRTAAARSGTVSTEALKSSRRTKQSTKRSVTRGTQRRQQPRTKIESPQPSPETRPKLTPMRFIQSDMTFAARSTLASSATTLLLARETNKTLIQASKILLHIIGVSGVVFTLISIAVDSASRNKHTPRTPRVINSSTHVSSSLQMAQMTSLVCTTIFCAACAAMYQRQLLRHLIFSFDFAFISFQLTSVHLCVCDLVRWDRGASFVIGASWLWMHWVLAIDALTPLMQHYLGFHTRTFALPIIALFIVYQVVIVVDIVFDPLSTLQDRIVLEYVLGADHRLQLRVVPFLLSRLVTLLSWSLRILWRLWTLKVNEGELVLIQGSISYSHARNAAPSPRTMNWTLSQRRPRLSSLQTNFRTPVVSPTSPRSSNFFKPAKSTSTTSVMPISSVPNALTELSS